MTISVVGTAVANATSLTLPTHQAGDLIVLAVYRNNATGHPTCGIFTTPTPFDELLISTDPR